MSLILAVEPDRRRGRQLASLVRKFTTAEIVVAQSGAAALSAIGKRVPDLILTPALMPTQDETVINGWLRELGDAAAHVQTLDVPILAESASAEAMTREQGSILGRLLDRNDAGGSGHGCDPSVFADQIKVYLDRAASDRSARKEPERPSSTPVSEPTIEVIASEDDQDTPKEEFDFEEISLDSLVLEPLFIDPPSPAPATDRAEPTRTEKVKADPAPREEPRRDTTATRAWEQELGLGGTPTSPALWRVAQGLPDSPPVDDVRRDDDWAYFDPSQTRFKALVRRLDEIVAQHAAQV